MEDKSYCRKHFACFVLAIFYFYDWKKEKRDYVTRLMIMQWIKRHDPRDRVTKGRIIQIHFLHSVFWA